MHSTTTASGSGIDVMRLPLFLRAILQQPPSRGHGLHQWIFRVARQLHAHGSENDICELLFFLLAESGAERREIIDAVHNSKSVAWQRSFKNLTAPKNQSRWPRFDPRLHAEKTKSAIKVEDLQKLSPARKPQVLEDPEKLVDLLFAGNPLLCCGFSSSRFKTMLREEWRGNLARMQFVVPSPMSSVTGTTRKGTESYRSLSNVGPRRFLVVEFDKGSLDEQVAVILALGETAPLVLVVHSGGKSMHAWFYCAGQSEDRLREFYAYAVRLGADPATFCPVQLVRMPGGVRENGNTQKVHYLNIANIKNIT